MHDNPGIAKAYETKEYKPYIVGSANEFLIGKDQQLALIFREADRLWMLSYEGLIKDLMDSLRKGVKPPSIEDQLETNMAAFRDEKTSYDAASRDSRSRDYGVFKGDTFLRTKTGFEIYQEYCQAWK